MSRTIRISRGLDVPVAGEPEQVVHPGPRLKHVALCGVDYIGLRPRLLVEVGAVVGLGQPLLEDKRDPGVCYGSPGRGTVVAINRGARRVLESIVVRLEDSGGQDLSFEALSLRQIEHLDRDRVAERLLRSGLWTAFRTRPFSRVPPSDSAPRAIFVTAIDTRPLAPDPAVVVARDVEAFATGLQLLTRLTQGTIWLCTAPNWTMALPEIERVQHVVFSGPHPAGLPGTHMHFLDPVGPGRTAWHIGFQDVTAFGRLFRKGSIDTERVVALCGVCINQPRLITTRLGASLEQLLRDGVCETAVCRVISGSLLGGRAATGALAFLGRYHDGLGIPEGGAIYPFGWLGLYPGALHRHRYLLKRTGFRRRHLFSDAERPLRRHVADAGVRGASCRWTSCRRRCCAPCW
jgi:Na+-transporting NADH:ubiquinone oxidoreductase subunit A